MTKLFIAAVVIAFFLAIGFVFYDIGTAQRIESRRGLIAAKRTQEGFTTYHVEHHGDNTISVPEWHPPRYYVTVSTYAGEIEVTAERFSTLHQEDAVTVGVYKPRFLRNYATIDP